MRGYPVAHEGTTYPSRRAFALAHGISRHSVYTRITAGVPAAEALVPTHGRTLTKVRTRGEWLVQFGHDISGLCTSAIWAKWGEVLGLLYESNSIIGIAGIFETSPRVIQRDLREFGIVARSKGGANHRTIEFYRRAQRVAVNEVRELQRERDARRAAR